YRLREEIHQHGDPEKALRAALATAGKAVIYVALAVGAGYSILMLSGFGLHTRFGFLVAVAMMVSCLAAIILVPALVYRFRPAFVFPSRKTELRMRRLLLIKTTRVGPCLAITSMLGIMCAFFI